jgi:hypothetical protein
LPAPGSRAAMTTVRTTIKLISIQLCNRSADVSAAQLRSLPTCRRYVCGDV